MKPEHVAIIVALAALAAVNLPPLLRGLLSRVRAMTPGEATEDANCEYCWNGKDVQALKQLTHRAEMLQSSEFSEGLDLVKEYFWPRQKQMKSSADSRELT